MATSPTLSGYRFGPFLLELRSGELTKNGRRIRLQEKPRSLLIAFAERPGEVITRAELHERLWPEDTFVDFEDGLNTAMRKLREALDDDPQTPRFIETVRGRGYRFVADVEPVAWRDHPHLAELTEPGAARVSAEVTSPAAAAQPGRRSSSHLRAAVVIALCAAAVGGFWYWFTHARPVLSFASDKSLLIADFDNQTGDSRFDSALQTAFAVSLEQSRHLDIYSRLQTARAMRMMARGENDRVTAVVGGEICRREGIHILVAPGITRAGRYYLLTAQLINPENGQLVHSYLERADGDDRILAALDSISTSLRRDLGESRYEIFESHRPLPQVTTASFAALQDYADGAAAFSHGRQEDAVHLYQAAIAADPGFAMAHEALGYAYYSFYFNEPDKGEQEYRKALALSSRVTEREHALIEARYAESQGRIEDALSLYQAYLREYPEDTDVNQIYGRILWMHGRAAEAIPIFQQILRRNPDDAGAHVQLATAYSSSGQPSPAIQEYQKAFSLEPHLIETGNLAREYGFTLVRDGQDAAAEQFFTSQLTSPARYGDAERSLAFLDLYHGRYISARGHLLRALPASADPFSVARIRYMLAVIAGGQGNRREQIAQLDRIMANFDALGEQVLYGSLVGQAYARSGEPEKARAILDRIAAKVNPAADEQVAFVHVLRAEVSAASGDLANALHMMKEPASCRSDSATVLTCEAIACLNQKAGNIDAAMQWYQRFLNSGDAHALSWEPQQQMFEAWYMLALDYRDKGDRAKATSTLNELLTRWKNADPGLPLLRDAQRLRSELAAGK
ncbi:MAG TPA: winged helix-turn-helix domain-containing protein [Acidobacteriaceae bacterium]|nr:winged helix-turn-helix domain-containing protein [Acidobacteriaceae bacterium]